jgi:ribosomal protein S18 acetylase RimI-like enzyme
LIHVNETVPGDETFAAFVELFDRYRVHYGQPADHPGTAAWLTEATTTGPMRAFLASIDGTASGACLVAIIPASLSLGELWMIRDLYVDPGSRRLGVARALLDHVRAAAERRGALRLSLQTEDDNAAAIRLYEELGFEPVSGLRHLTLPLRRNDGETTTG